MIIRRFMQHVKEQDWFAVWLYHRFNLSHRDIEDLLSERGIEVSYGAIRLWCNKFVKRPTKSTTRRS